jgi:hypothetical protein
MILGTYVSFLFISFLLTIWVAETLRANGIAFLVDVFNGDQLLAKSINHLLVVGFYLINLGFIVQTMATQDRPENLATVLELLSKKFGPILLILGFMHFFNLYLLAQWRASRIRDNSRKS